MNEDIYYFTALSLVVIGVLVVLLKKKSFQVLGPIVCIFGILMIFSTPYLFPKKPIKSKDPNVAKIEKLAEEIAWMDENVKPVIDKLIETGERKETATDPAEIQKIEQEFVVLSNKLDRLSDLREQKFGKLSEKSK